MALDPPKKRKRRKSTKKKDKPYYVHAGEFKEKIVQYYDSGTDDIGPDLGQSIYKIAKGLSFAPNFINYSYKDDMVGDAIVKMFSALQNKKFNPDKNTNPFSYFTTIAFHAFINRIKKEKKQRDILAEYQEHVYDNLSNAGYIVDTGPQSNEGSEDE